MSSPIQFFNEDISFTLLNPNLITKWVEDCANNFGYSIESLNYIFCSDKYLLNINQEYLNHDTYTDIITFDNSEDENIIESDIFISIERIEENGKTMGTSFQDELHRVMIHGVLHLLGFADKTEEEKKIMRTKEDFYLEKLDT